MLKNKHIVTIDDTPAIRDVLRIALEAHGAIVHEAATASYGLALCQQLSPDLVILDLGLPDKEGLNILPQIKRLNKQRKLSVIVLTVRKEQKYIDMAMELEADAYVTKPFIMENLIEIIESKLDINPDYLKLVKSDAPDDEANNRERKKIYEI